MSGSAPLLEARGLVKTFPLPGAPLLDRMRGRVDLVQAVDRVDVRLEAGECLAIVGESGSGKTTLGRCLLRLVEADAGTVRFKGEELGGLAPGALRRRRKSFQMVFQDPQESFNPRMRIAEVLTEPLRAHRTVAPERIPERVRRLLDLVGLDPESGDRFPHQFSGGQRQRIGIARALASEPDLLVADEPVSALDLVAQAEVIGLLRDLQSRLGLGVLFIAHDLAAVRRLADRVAVMRRGRIVEEAPTERIFSRPEHPYTVDLLRAIPRLRPGSGRRRGGHDVAPSDDSAEVAP